eukprot:scaffold33538_cov179-Skeletonema_dohrnii-CCMP3373.AAC.4
MMRCTRVVDAKEPASLLVVAIFEVVVREEDIEVSGSPSKEVAAKYKPSARAVALEMKVESCGSKSKIRALECRSDIVRYRYWSIFHFQQIWKEVSR